MNFFRRKKTTPDPPFEGTVAVRFERGGVFAPGEVVSGELVWTKKHSCNLKIVTAHVYGFVHAPIYHPDRVVANSIVKPIYRPPDSKSPVAAGETRMPFTMQGLGLNIPNSFAWESEGIHVEYSITFTFLLRHGKREYGCFKAPFLVLKPLSDLRATGPSVSKSPNNILNPSNKIDFSVKPFSPVLYPGMDMKLDISIQNRSFKDIFSLTISLVQSFKLGQHKTKRTIHQVVFSATPEFPIRGLQRGVDSSSSPGITSAHVYPFVIPSPPPELPSSFRFQHILVSYELNFSLLINKKPWNVPWKITIRQCDDMTLRQHFANRQLGHDNVHGRERSPSSPPKIIASPAPGPSQSVPDVTVHRPAPPPPQAPASSYVIPEYFYPPQYPYPPPGPPPPYHYYYPPSPGYFSGPPEFYQPPPPTNPELQQPPLYPPLPWPTSSTENYYPPPGPYHQLQPFEPGAQAMTPSVEYDLAIPKQTLSAPGNITVTSAESHFDALTSPRYAISVGELPKGMA